MVVKPAAVTEKVSTPAPTMDNDELAADKQLEESTSQAADPPEKERVVIGSSDLLKHRGGKKSKKGQHKGGD